MKPLHLLSVACSATLMYIVYLVTAVAAEGPVLPHPLDVLVLMALATMCAILASMWSAARLRDTQRANAEHFDRRLDCMTNLIAESLSRAERTQELPPFPTTYRATVSTNQPVALPAPDTVAAMKRLAHRVTRPE